MAIERIEPGTKEWIAYYANHLIRYHFALDIIKEKKSNEINILDIACGVGYGSKLLADQLSEMKIHISGVDLDERSIAIAKKQFNHPNIDFVIGNAEERSVFSNKGAFDFIISFETFEHLKNPKKFLDNCYDLLNKDGFLILSTPNAKVTGGAKTRNWEFHEREYTATELAEHLVAARFQPQNWFGQQLTDLGKLRSSLRAEIHKIVFNPFVRLGFWLQKVFRGRKFSEIVLPEQMEDFVFIPYEDFHKIDEKKSLGPFVILVVATKK